MNWLKNLLLVLCLALFSAGGIKAQNVALKTNILSDAAADINLGIEIGLAPHWTIDITGDLNDWSIKGRNWKHWLVQPEARYWLCDRFAGHFFGVHALGGEYSIGYIKNSINLLGWDLSKLTDHRYRGWAAGGGISYGYAWILGKHWNFEAEIGIGYAYVKYDTFVGSNEKQHKISEGNSRNYFGPTKLALNFVYIF